MTAAAVAHPAPARVSTGIAGLDDILGGGLTPARMYLLEGEPGTGKTTFGLSFLMAGAAVGERGLYITLSETAGELSEVVDSHGWSLDGIDLHELVNELGVDPQGEQSIRHPSEIELGETIMAVTREIDRLNQIRVVFDSLSEKALAGPVAASLPTPDPRAEALSVEPPLHGAAARRQDLE